MALLEIRDLVVRYGEIEALRGVSIGVDEGQVVTLLGANGAGKSTTLRAISGLAQPASGDILFDGKSIAGLGPEAIVRMGISHVPEGRRIFAHLTVEENLVVSFLSARASMSAAEAMAAVYELFPRLAERRRQAGGTLSGGEQQMLAIGRAMMNFPKLLMLDEPSLGLSPVLAELVFERLAEIQRQGTTILLVEQNATCLELATRGIILANGHVVLAGDRHMLQDSDFVRRAYLGV